MYINPAEVYYSVTADTEARARQDAAAAMTRLVVKYRLDGAWLLGVVRRVELRHARLPLDAPRADIPAPVTIRACRVVRAIEDDSASGTRAQIVALLKAIEEPLDPDRLGSLAVLSDDAPGLMAALVAECRALHERALQQAARRAAR